MAYDSIYTRINWENEKNTPLGATNLNKMDYALSEIDKRVVNLDSVKAEKSTVLNLVSDWQMNEETGIITVTKVSGEQIVFDLNVEKIPVSFEMSEDGILSMTTEDGSVFTANIGDMIPIMTFNSSDSINVTVSEDENGKAYTFEVKDGSVTEEKLNPNYLASLKVASETAKENADIAIENANSAIDSAESAKQYRNEAEQFRNEAESIVGVEVSQITSDIALNRQTLGYTKKNLIKTSLNIMKEQNTVGAWNGNVYTANGGTFTVNEDLSVTINGTFTADTQCSLNKQLDYAIDKYTLSAGVKIPANVYLTAYTKSNGGVSIPSGYQQLTYDYSSNITQVYIYVKSGVAVNNLTLYPMLRLASITDSSYEPYVDDVDTRLKSLESGGGSGGTGTVTTDYEDLENKPSINGVALSGDKTTADLGIANATQSADGLMSATDKKKLDRTVASLVPNIAIPANADLNTVEYIKIGTYFCQDNNRAQTLINCPILAGFTMEVYNVLNTKIDNESSDAYVYRLRKITTWNGEIFYQTISSGSTAGVYSYRNWEKIYSSFNKPTASDVGADTSGSAAKALTDAKAYTDEKVPTKISQLENDGKFVEFDEYGNLNVPQWVNALGLETSDGIRDSGGIDEDNYYGGNAVVKTEDELSSLTAEGYMPDALLVKALHQRMGGYSFYNNPYVVYERLSSEPFLLDGEYILSDSDTGSIYITDTENYYSAIVSGDYKRREGADTVSPFSGLGNIECVAELFSGDKYITSKNCLIFVHGANTTESGLPTTIKPVVSSGILNELAKTTAKKWDGHYHAIAVYYLSLNGESSIISLASGSTPKALIFV